MAAKNSTKTAQTETISSAVVINISKVVMDNLTVAKDQLSKVTVDINNLENGLDLVVDLAGMIVVLSDDVDNHLVTVVKSKKSSGVDSKKQLGDLTIESLVKMLDEAITLIKGTEQFGNTRLSVRSIKQIKGSSDKIKDLASELYIQDTLYRVRNN